MDKNKLVLPVSILLGCIVLGGFYYASQVSKQKSIENQQQIKIDQDRKAETIRQFSLTVCLDTASTNYRALIAVNSNADGTYKSLSAQKYVEDKYTNERDDCYKQYK